MCVFNITSFIFPGNVIKFSAFRHCFANFRHNVSLAMFRFLGPRAGSSCRLSSVTRARSLPQFSSLLLRVCPCSSSSQRSLRAVLGQRRPVHCLRHAGNTCEYTLHKTNDSHFISVSTYFSSFAHPTLSPGGGDGLFAVRDIEADTFISFYHGELCQRGQNFDNPCTGRRPDTWG